MPLDAGAAAAAVQNDPLTQHILERENKYDFVEQRLRLELPVGEIMINMFFGVGAKDGNLGKQVLEVIAGTNPSTTRQLAVLNDVQPKLKCIIVYNPVVSLIFVSQAHS